MLACQTCYSKDCDIRLNGLINQRRPISLVLNGQVSFWRNPFVNGFDVCKAHMVANVRQDHKNSCYCDQSVAYGKKTSHVSSCQVISEFCGFA